MLGTCSAVPPRPVRQYRHASVNVLMMNVGIMSVRVQHLGMTVRMRLRLAPVPVKIVFMLMVFVVRVTMRVFHRLMRMGMCVVLS